MLHAMYFSKFAGVARANGGQLATPCGTGRHIVDMLLGNVAQADNTEPDGGCLIHASQPQMLLPKR